MKRTILIAALTGAMAFLAPGATRAQPQQPDWCRSKWGPNDEIGAANLLTPDVALNASKLVKTGRTYSLGVETNAKTPAFGPRSWALVINQPS
jgi:hypothetical protein